jgi:hypothetical protein
MFINPPISDNPELDFFLTQVKLNLDDVLFIIERNKKIGASGTFISDDGKTITVTNGIITKIEE